MENVEQEKHSITKNVLILCFSVMLIFAAFKSMSALQSSINKVLYQMLYFQFVSTTIVKHMPCLQHGESWFFTFQVDGLGTWSNTAVYASLVVSCMFLPTYVIKTVTVKWTIPISMFCYTIYMSSQFYPEFYTIIPGAVVGGLGSALLLSAKSTYLTQVRETPKFSVCFYF